MKSITSPTWGLVAAGSENSLTGTSSVSPRPYTSSLCQRIQKAAWSLCDIPNRVGWQTDVIAALLKQANPVEGYDALADPRLDDILAGFDLYLRFFEVGSDLAFKHQPEKFDEDGFLHFQNPWTYADRWWQTVSESALKMAETFLVSAGVLEFRETDMPQGSITSVRFRADRVYQILLHSHVDRATGTQS